MFLIVGLSSPAAAQERGRVHDLVVFGVTIVDVATGQLTTDRAILVDRGRIAAVADRRTARAAKAKRSIEASGKFAIPGLWDMHVEQALPLSPQTPLDSNPGFFFPMFLAHGVTGVRDVAGAPEILARWRAAVERGDLAGPRIVFTGPKVGQERPNTPTFPVGSPAELERIIDSLKRAGASDAYILTLPREYYATLRAASTRANLPVGGLIPLSVSLAQAIEAGQRSIDHFDGILIATTADERRVRWMLSVSERRPWWARALWRTGLWEPIASPAGYALDRWSATREREMIAMLARARVYQVPTLRLLGNLNRAGDSALMMPPEPFGIRVPRRPWSTFAAETVSASHPQARVTAQQRRIIGEMSRGGVPLMAGSDPPNLYAAPGMSLHDELELLVASGLRPVEALRAATLTPAEFLGATDSLGTIAAGKVADFVLLDADPTTRIQNTRRIFAVIARGRFYDRGALDALIARARVVAEPITGYWRARLRSGGSQ